MFPLSILVYLEKQWGKYLMQENSMSYLCRVTEYPKTSRLKQQPFIMVVSSPASRVIFFLDKTRLSHMPMLEVKLPGWLCF